MSIPGIPNTNKGLTTLTITGLDEKTDIDRLVDLSHEFHFVEWGILLGSRNGPRYPSVSIIEKLVSLRNWYGLRMALHLCGKFSQAWVSDPSKPNEHRNFVLDLAQQFDRVQLNLSFPDGFVIRNVREAIINNGHPGVITQYREKLTPTLVGLDNHAVLFDASGGRGISQAEWPSMLLDHHCGYAGGLGPDNLATELPRIHTAASGCSYWVDMETKVRNPHTDVLDLDKCETVLKIVNEFEHIPRWTQKMLDDADTLAEQLLRKGQSLPEAD
jgi:hypothetical protein